MSSSDEFDQRYSAATFSPSLYANPRLRDKAIWDAAWNAATKQQREKILLIIEDVKTDHHARDGRADGYDLDTCDEILRRIKEGDYDE